MDIICQGFEKVQSLNVKLELYFEAFQEGRGRQTPNLMLKFCRAD